MLGLLLDTFILIVLVRVITGDEEEGFLKPGLIALLAGLALFAASLGAANAGATGLWILIGAILGVAVLVALCCIALLNVTPKNSAIIGGAFAGYKILFSVGIALLMSG